MLIGAPIGRHVKTLHRRADEWVLTGDTHTEATSNPIWGLFFGSLALREEQAH